MQYVSVRIAWLTLPIVCWFLTLALLAIVIGKSYGSAIVGTWKSSPMTLLFHGRLNKPYLEDLGDYRDELLASEDGLERAATRFRGCLQIPSDQKDRPIFEVRET
jgi:hypothetical protein